MCVMITLKADMLKIYKSEPKTLEKIARESRNRIITTRQTKCSYHTCPRTA